MSRKNNLNVPDDYLEQVWWAEGFKEYHEVNHGYLLAQYSLGNKQKYIVSLGDITSTVVRHVDKYYYTEKEAYASIIELPSANRMGEYSRYS